VPRVWPWAGFCHTRPIAIPSLVACHRQNLDLSLLLHWLVWERNWVWTYGLISRRAVHCIRSPFSQEQWDPSKSIDVSRMVAIHGPREIRMVKGHTCIEHEKRVPCWSIFPLQDVHRFKSPRLSDMSTAYLCQSSRR
jgi:hypothetical protein